MKRTTGDIWFPAKRYGWGWGLPVAWQGWVVLVAYGALLVLGSRWLAPTREPLAFVLLVGASTVGLLVVVWLKGEAPGQGGQ